MHREAEDQGQAGGVVGGGDDGAQGHLDTRPRGEDDAGLEGDDAVGDASNARRAACPSPGEPKLLQNIHIFRETREKERGRET